MKSLLTSSLFSIAAFGLDAAHAFEHPACGTADEAACMLDAIWSAAEHLPAEKQNRLKAPFLETVAKSGDTLLLRHWQARLGADLRREKAVEPYARKKAKAALSRGNWTAFLRDARAGAQPFNIGRPEIMAEGARLAPDAPTRRRVVDAMFELAGRPIAASGLDRSFEQADFGHSLAELAMEACDLSSFDRAIALTADPESLRYALWRRRITGQAGALAGRIRADANSDDTHHVRLALDGYGPVLKLGYCN
ncbi:hypothetical protein [Hyphomonas atlantica corrig.]|uniref:hypothetical protein n=1 Tax=Hyphomonas atlantica TaxID=1280948 RepID=UPI0023565955|nr:hypothetical protein [Hyphomonas atlantica]